MKMFSESNSRNAPQSIDQFISQHETELAAVRKEWPDYPVGPTRIRAEEAVLDDLVAFMNAEDGCEASKDFITQLSVSGSSFLAVTLKAKQSVTAVAKALSKYCGMRRCKICDCLESVDREPSCS
jgi:hypothetical protein